MAPEVKFCGLTRAEDAAAAAALGASHAGVIFAGGPRLLTMDRAVEVLAGLPPTMGRVGVFADQDPGTVASFAASVGLTAVQLHAPRSPAELADVRRAAGTELWAVVRVAGGRLPAEYEALADAADAVVVDALVPGQLGGTGTAVDWERLAVALERRGRPRRLVLAGGLRPENVAHAVAIVAPDVVDVSSGVESAPGIKDRDRMRRFALVAAGAAADSTQPA